jgi:predicted RNase H-like HicB family nuclease
MKYPVLIDGKAGAYGVVFPDLPGCVAMGSTIDEAMRNAEDAMRDWVESMKSYDQAIPAPSALETVNVPDGSVIDSIAVTGRKFHAPGN